MCGLCGALGSENHWVTDIEDPQQAYHQRRRSRAYRLKLINAVLTSRRIAVEDFQASGFILATATGKREIVEDPGSLWRQAEQLSGSELDPLDSTFLASLG